MVVGQSQNNTTGIMDVSSLSAELGKPFFTTSPDLHVQRYQAYMCSITRPACAALPGLHALTGCDYSPAFKGEKVNHIAVENNMALIVVFAELGYENNSEETKGIIEEFVCSLYLTKRRVL